MIEENKLLMSRLADEGERAVGKQRKQLLVINNLDRRQFGGGRGRRAGKIASLGISAIMSADQNKTQRQQAARRKRATNASEALAVTAPAQCRKAVGKRLLAEMGLVVAGQKLIQKLFGIGAFHNDLSPFKMRSRSCRRRRARRDSTALSVKPVCAESSRTD